MSRWARFDGFTHLFPYVATSCGCFPVIRASIPKSEAVKLFLWGCSDSHSQQKMHQTTTRQWKDHVYSLWTPRFWRPQQLRGKKTPFLNHPPFPSSLASCVDWLTAASRVRVTKLFLWRHLIFLSLRHNHLHACEIMTNHVTNQTWKLRLTSGYLTPVSHLSCISRGERHVVAPPPPTVWFQHVVVFMYQCVWVLKSWRPAAVMSPALGFHPCFLDM